MRSRSASTTGLASTATTNTTTAWHRVTDQGQRTGQRKETLDTRHQWSRPVSLVVYGGVRPDASQGGGGGSLAELTATTTTRRGAGRARQTPQSTYGRDH